MWANICSETKRYLATRFGRVQLSNRFWCADDDGDDDGTQYVYAFWFVCVCVCVVE